MEKVTMPDGTQGAGAPTLTIREGTVAEARELEATIDELAARTYRSEEYAARLDDVEHVILVAAVSDDGAAERLVGFQVGYRLDETTFYYWIGGVVATDRQRGVATALRAAHEAWARAHGYSRFRVKTLNRHRAMLALLVAAEYEVVGTEPDSSDGVKIVFEREL